ncbi:cutinase family protein [Nocardia salmonicida]|uniref:cutinase family protein n=1 Tax=Nocardia salmonicida TaxID=53431 RepID=UPI000A03EA5C|nr:cutinase family protein [Nocardia salmonicida]
MKQHWARKVLVGAVAALSVTSAVTITGAGNAAAIGAAGCTPYTALIAPGTWETTAAADMYQQPANGMLNPLGSGLKSKFGNDITVLYVPYAASAFDQGLAYTQSKATLTSKIKEILTGLCSSTKLVLAGYSQGADGMGDVASEIGNGKGPIGAERVLGVGLLSDPRRDPKSTLELGTQQDGHGIAGVRPEGFGSLTKVTRSICGDGDLYCSVSDSASPIVSAIGQTLGGNTDSSSDSGQLASSLVSDFSRGDLAGIASTVSTLADRTKSLPSENGVESLSTATDVAGVGSGASSLVGTLTPLQDVATFVKDNPSAAEALKTAPQGSNEAAANSVLDAVSKIDITGAISSAASLANTASQLLSGGGSTSASTTTGGTNAKDALSTRADQLSTATSPLTSLDTSTLSSGLSILKLLKPNTIIKQITNAVTGAASTAANLPAILDCFVKLPGAIATGDINGAHKLAGDINNLFSPVIKMAAGVDLSLIASIITAASVFDPSGTATIVGMVVGFLANLDIVRIANDIGQAQEVLWAAVDKLTKGDLLGAGAAMTGLAPVGIDLAAAVASMFTGGGTKTDVSQLGKSGTVGQQANALSTSVGSADLAGMANALLGIAGSDGVGDLVDVASQGLEVATFYASGAHVNYGQGVQQLLTFLSGQIPA